MRPRVKVNKKAGSRDHQEERCKPKGDQSGLEEKGSRSPARTVRIQATGRSLDTRVVKSRSRSRRSSCQSPRRGRTSR
ncbi:hypothetical protein TNCV_2352581 [Trichonephila clavipes]|nr:hypothetical protein TNCV_2352581 [Trichonephila clavipes]